MRRILVTGGFGFVGSQIVRHLHRQGLEVVVMEQPHAARPADLTDLQLLPVDIADAEAVRGARLTGVDAVLHLAAQSSGPRSFSVPALDIQVNVLGTLNVIEWCLQNGVDRLISASSFVVYGDQPGELLDESWPCRPKSVYASSKLAAEHLLMNYAQPKGIRWSALRMFNVYGPGQDITRGDQGVVGIFMNMLREQDVVQVRGSLNRFRDLVYIDDVVQAWDRCLQTDAAYNQIFNVGTGIKTTFGDLIRALATVMGKRERLRIEELGGTQGDIEGCVADLTRIRERLGYAPRYDLATGLAQMWRWVDRGGES